MVDLYVGQTKAHYHLHKTMLYQKIPYFDKMFNGGFKEAKAFKADFPDDSVTSFDVLVAWVYTGQIREYSVLPDKSTSLPTNYVFSDLLTKLWTYYEVIKHEIPNSRHTTNAKRIIDQLHPAHPCVVSASIPCYIVSWRWGISSYGH